MDAECTPLPTVSRGMTAVPMPRSPRGEKDGMKTWKSLGIVLGVIAGAATVAMGLGKAFYVTRDEYNAKERSDVIVGETLKKISSQLDSQQAALDKLSEKVVEMQLDIAILAKKRR